jgi:hypothetical protein
MRHQVSRDYDEIPADLRACSLITFSAEMSRLGIPKSAIWIADVCAKLGLKETG